MSREQAKKVLASFGIEEPTEEQVTAYLNSIGSEIQKEKSKAEAHQAEIERLKEIEAEYTKQKDASLTAEEKYQKAIKDAEANAKKYAYDLNRMKAENILVSGGIKTDEIGDLLDGIVSDDAERTTKLASGLVGLLNSKVEAAGKAKEAELLQNMTPPPAGGTTATITKEQFKGMSYSERTELFQSSPDLFNQLNS
jgi:cell division septum initiation protein DivIVA